MSAPESAPSGACLIADGEERGRGAAFVAVAAASGEPLAPEFASASHDQVDRACEAAAACRAAFAATTQSQRAALLRSIAANLLALGDSLLQRTHAETGLPLARLTAERGRTVGQLELYANLLSDGSWVDARLESADRARAPQPKPDLRAMLVPLGPVAVFGASNFPFAYSAAGGDTASALAAGCPVVLKAHPAHPGASELAAQAVRAALRDHGLPAACYQLLHGNGHEVGQALVVHPSIAAVGFTGSVQGGTSLWRAAQQRAVPIPVFAEMGSANPVVLFAGALAARGPELADLLAASGALACGQFCTSPGMILVPTGPAGDAFVLRLQAALAAAAPQVMVHPSLSQGFLATLQSIVDLSGVEVLQDGAQRGSLPSLRPTLLSATSAAVRAHERLREEIYGPAMLVVRWTDAEDLRVTVGSLGGHLTATVHGEPTDLESHVQAVRELQSRVGRMIFGGVPTGVEVAAAMQHGGPWPASTDSRYTAVGPRAILRWVRSLSFQDCPPELLPPELQDGNPLGIWRTKDGVLGKN